tara:strand:+ start:2156 stop:2944 length:789 start_codon:yes stop_codon:yes gene_type:complete
MRINEIFIWLFIFVIGSIIVSGLLYPESLDNLKSNIKDTIKVPDIKPKKISLNCEENLPNYFLLDSSEIFNLRAGQKEDENVNYYYYKEEGTITYQEQVVSDDGVILGTTRIVYSPVLNDLNPVWEEKLEKLGQVEGVKIVGEETTYILNWEGITGKVKQLIEEDIKIEVSKDNYYSRSNFDEKVFCSDTISSESGEFKCDIDESYYDDKAGSILNSEGQLAYGRTADVELGKGLKVKISPEIFRKNLYEIIDHRISECEIV